jgi:nitrous oxide reductase accessory protein NosL
LTRKKWIRWWIIALICCWAMPSSAADAPEVRAGRRPLGPDLALQLDPADRCPVCAMQVVKYQKFAAAIQLADATTYYFCATGCMIRSWLHPEIYLGCAKSELARPVVQAYLTGRPTDARDVVWVAGSDVIGPMGPYLTPLAPANVEAFMKRHGGKRTFRLADMDDALWEAITRKPAP